MSIFSKIFTNVKYEPDTITFKSISPGVVAELKVIESKPPITKVEIKAVHIIPNK